MVSIYKEKVLKIKPHAFIKQWANPNLFSGIRYCVYNGFAVAKICYGMSENKAWENAYNKLITPSNGKQTGIIKEVIW